MTATLDEQEKKEIRQVFDKAVNMSAPTLTKWLQTEESKSVGQTKEGSKESIGHQSGKRIIDILQKKVGELTESDYEHMQKVVGYVKRHSAQRPEHVANSDWAYSLKNWGHDPEK
ncbi:MULTISPECIES: DUF3140 domain-containing protein [unclassified Spirosoma]|uniref:DUF3140 domain-containing protein n=1 Tax=unclassified Spirosoma TaxID=2621999 RepID=UPI00095A3ECE|nr:MULTISPECIES: DUF3140 domain-containing protein [unclassified Spirosoma]MBN8825338.1 DUF3140 domain-containing protein [Spirosoma sp.]OJW77493.1 MAG: DNA-binding protein [Spirosoma sp. 48-14]